VLSFSISIFLVAAGMTAILILGGSWRASSAFTRHLTVSFMVFDFQVFFVFFFEDV
jgi:hypothetical protein